MTAVTVSSVNNNFADDFKEAVVVLTGTPSTGYTYDTKMNATNGRAAVFREIFSATYSDNTGQVVASTWDTTTGVVTLGTISTPVAKGYLTIKGR